MNIIRKNLAVIFALVLLAGPFMQISMAMSAVDSNKCNCCQGSCKGCCCSIPEQDKSGVSDQSEHNCHCELTTLPVFPDDSIKALFNNANHKAALNFDDNCDQAVSLVDINNSSIKNNSPPIFRSTPAYIQFGAYLI